MLLVSGDGKKTGKTTLMCRLISHFADKLPLVAIKVSPHIHPLAQDEEFLEAGDLFQITQEKKTGKETDSSRFLYAGAIQVFYIQTRDEQLIEALNRVLKKVATDTPLLVESGGMRRFVTPGLHFHLLSEPQPPHFSSSGGTLHISDLNRVCPENKIFFHNQRWILPKTD